MKRTTVYLQDQQARDLKLVSASTGTSEAELIRQGVAHVLRQHAPRPRGLRMVVDSGDPDWANRTDEMLADGFGADGLSR